MAIRKKVLGENHPHYAGSLINLAGLYNIQGDFARRCRCTIRRWRSRKRSWERTTPTTP